MPYIFNPTKYALYVSAQNPTRQLALDTSQSITEPPQCITQNVPMVATLIHTHLSMGHEVLVLDMYSVCQVAQTYTDNSTGILTNASSTLKTQMAQSKWDQVMDFYQNKVSSVFANGKSPTSLNIFAEQIRGYVLQFVNNQLPWPDSTTRKLAHEKISQVNIRIGTGTRNINDCTEYTTLACIQQQWSKTLGLLGKNVDPSKTWSMSSAEVNAYYSPLHNHVVIPYGIAQPPLYSDQYPSFWNVAGLGVVIGHELGHSIDPSSVDFTATGEYHPWLTQSSSQSLQDYISCVDNYYVDAGMSSQRATVTINENIADFIGVRAISTGINALPIGSMDVYKEVYVLFAQTWCRVGGDIIHDANYTDPHSSSRLRVNVTLTHDPQFNSVFNCGRTQSNSC